jgi:organic hydroperoxide reductase OsmC/OhrA
MPEHHATVTWKRSGEGFLQAQFSRNHQWTFDGGLSVPATAAPSVVPPPWTDPSAVDPEEAFVASIASCHLLTFLFVAAKAGHSVDHYEDQAVGILAKNEKGIPWIAKVTLRPRVTFTPGTAPTAEQEAALHAKAHHYCYIANSVKTEILIEPVRS